MFVFLTDLISFLYICYEVFVLVYVQAAWMLLAELSQFSSSIELKFLLDSWKQHHPSVTMATHTPFVQILVVIGNMARKLSKIAMQDVRG